MSMQSSPSSGLSLILHLVIIATATVFGFIFGRNALKLARVGGLTDSLPNGVALWLKRTLSITIIVGLTMLMVLFTSIAIKTGIREGENEWHMQYFKKTTKGFGETSPMVMDSVVSLFSKTINYDQFDSARSDAYQSLPVPFASPISIANII